MIGNESEEGGKDRVFPFFFFAIFSGDEDSILTASKSAARMVMS